LINFYLRFTISQERLSELAIVSIENEILVELEYNNLISNFTSQKAIKKQLNEKKNTI
jgi:cobalamin biosynthesis Co2+ chelatase CbiK